MTQSTDYKAPPLQILSRKVKKREIKIWRLFTSLDKKKKATAIFLSLKN